MMRRKAFIIMLFIIAASGCRDGNSDSKIQADAMDRLLLGIPTDYDGDDLSHMEDELRTNPILQRRMAWSIVERLWREQNVSAGPHQITLPQWKSWYDSKDFKRIFSRATDTANSEPLDDANIHAAEEWNVRMLRTLPHYSQSLEDERIQSLSSSEASAHSLGGFSRTYYSPELIRNVLRNSKHLADCFANRARTDLVNKNDCLPRDFSANTVAVKSFWQSADEPLPLFKTDADTFENIRNGSYDTWKSDRYVSRPADDEIYRIRLQSGVEHELRAMHIATKQLEHWVWITLWWSPDYQHSAENDQSLGISQSILRNYQMCAVYDFDDADGSKSWCSNPYLETDRGLARTNCIGCHQHAAPLNRLLSEEEKLERRQTVDHSPFDYLWSLGADPENLSAYIYSNK